MTTRSSGLRKKSEDQEMARCSSKREAQPINSLSANSEVFIKLFDERQKRIQASLNNCQSMSKKVKQLNSTIGGFILGGLFVFLVIYFSVACFIRKEYIELLILFCLIAICAIAIVIALILEYKSCLDRADSSIRDFRKAVFLLIIELGKLKQRCEDVEGSLSGSENQNLRRLEVSILELFKLMEALRDTVTLHSVGEVSQEYVKIFSELEKMKVRLSFYRGTSDEPRTKI